MSRRNGYLDSFVDQAGFRQHGGILSGISKGDHFIGSSGTIAISGYLNVSFTTAGVSGFLGYSISGKFGQCWEATPPWAYTYAPTAAGMEEHLPPGLSGHLGIFDIYRAGGDKNFIDLNATYGDLIFVADTAKVDFCVGQRANMRLSGILYAPINTGSTNEFGDIHPCLHGVLQPVPKLPNALTYTDPTDSDIMRATALGVGGLFFNTGSGIINIMNGSGIEQLNFTTYKGGTTFPIDDTKERFLRLPISTLFIDDRNITYHNTPTGLSIMSPGLYKCQYNVSFRRATVNATFRQIAVRAALYPNAQGIGGGAGGAGTSADSSKIIPNSTCYASAFSANGAVCSLSHSFLFNADQNDFFALEGSLVDATSAAGQGLNMTTSGVTASIFRIGPKRGNFR